VTWLYDYLNDVVVSPCIIISIIIISVTGVWCKGRDVSDTSCAAHTYDIQQEMHSNSTDVYCVQWAAPVLLGIYLLIANVLLLNLLIAIFR